MRLTPGAIRTTPDRLTLNMMTADGEKHGCELTRAQVITFYEHLTVLLHREMRRWPY